MGVLRWARALAVGLCVVAAVAGCGRSDTLPTDSVTATAAQVKLPGTAQPCVSGQRTDRCSLAWLDAREAATDITKQLRALGLEPKPALCEKVTAKMPEQCVVQVVGADSHALSFFAFPHLLPTLPARFEGVETVLAVS